MCAAAFLRFTPQKTARSTGFELQCPVRPVLARDDCRRPLQLGWRTTSSARAARALKAETFGSYMRKWCDEAGLPGSGARTD